MSPTLVLCSMLFVALVSFASGFKSGYDWRVWEEDRARKSGETP